MPPLRLLDVFLVDDLEREFLTGGAVDRPNDGAEVAGAQLFHGLELLDSGLPSGVDARLDPLLLKLRRLKFGAPRIDVREHLQDRLHLRRIRATDALQSFFHGLLCLLVAMQAAQSLREAVEALDVGLLLLGAELQRLRRGRKIYDES
eukprot:scaffold3685_cov242-Pinguiococcus_pyrenoidosus.AAC.7